MPAVVVTEGRRHLRVVDVALYAAGVAGLAACLTVVFLGMRAVLDIGGACADGGPYVVRQPCPEGVPLLLVGGIFGLFGFGGLVAWKGSVIGGPYGALVALAWPALFISLGWNFLEYGFFPPVPGQGIVWGWLIPGIVFMVMGGGPLLALWPSRAGRKRIDATGSAARSRAHAQLATRLDRLRAQRAGETDEDLVGKLERLDALRRSGSLTELEFERAKQMLLDSRQGA